MALKRLYVHQSRYRELLDGFGAIVDEYVIGDGLDPEVMVDVINESTGMNSATKRTMKQQVISRKFGGGFAWDLKFKDFVIAMELARRTGTPVPLSGMAFQLNEAAQIWMNETGDKTAVEIVRWMEHMAGVEIGK